jgi:hypothetical protein
MSTRNRLAAVVLCAGGVASLAHAQPVLTEDLGALSTGTVSREVPFSTSQVFWYKFTVPAIPAGTAGPGAVYLDIRTAQPSGGTILDTEIALYNASGTYATGVAGTSSDDDDGPGNASALTYGLVCPARANAGAGTQAAGAVFDGRDGGLAPGDYYLVVAPYNATFSGTNWGVTPGSQTGPMTLEITYGTGTDPVPAPTLTAGTASSVNPGSSIVVTTTAAACGTPTGVTLDASSLGAGGSIQMFDDGTNGDGAANDRIWTAIIPTTNATAPGSYTLIATATNAQGSTTRNINANVVAPGATLTPVAGQYAEIEDNNNKLTANRVPAMVVGEYITGTTTGTSTTATGNGTADYFLITTTPAPLGIYRHRLQITTTGAVGHTGTIRGLSQSNGVITAGTDSEAQGSSTTTTPARMNQWYGFGKRESIFYRVTGTTSSTGTYVSTLSTEPVTPVSLGNFAPGEIVITTIAQSHTVDTDLMVLDANLSPVPGYSNDDETVAEGGTGATAQSRLTRTYAPGTYYLALSNYNLTSNQPSPATDDFRTPIVVDFPDVVLNSSTSTAASMQFAVIDANGTQTFPAAKPGAYDVYFATFTVGTTGPTCGTSDFNGDGDFGTDADIEAFFACLGGTCCPTCFEGGSDFNGDGDFGTDQDIESFFRVLAGGNC